jgi:hypothetical protein
MAKKELRIDEETGDVFVTIINNLKRIAHDELTDENGDRLKVRLSSEFLSAFNSHVLKVFLSCVENVVEDGRTVVTPDDIPDLEEEDDYP